jgi:hypothetical protein
VIAADRFYLGTLFAIPLILGGVVRDTTWNHDPRTWLLDMALLLALGAGYGFVAWRRLARRIPGRRAARRK